MLKKPLTKKCSTCLLDKELTAFGRCSTRHDGFQPQCRACRKEISAAHYARNKAKLKQRREQRKDQRQQQPGSTS